MIDMVCSLLEGWVRHFSSSLSGWASFFHIGVPVFLERLLLMFLPPFKLFPWVLFLFTTVLCWRLGRRWTVLFPSVVHHSSLPLHLLIMFVLSLVSLRNVFILLGA